MSSLKYQNGLPNYGVLDVFLPESLVKLVFKIALKFNVPSFDEFSLIDTLQQWFNNKLMTFNGDDIDDRRLCLSIIAVLKVSEKFNNINSQLSKTKIDTIFSELGITEKMSIGKDEFTKQEFTIFQEMNFKVKSPSTAEAVFELIEKHLADIRKRDFLLEFSFDILRLVYSSRSQIYDG